MSNLKRKIGASGCEETENSDYESKVSRDPPKKKYRPFMLSLRDKPLSNALSSVSSGSKSPSATKPPLKTPAATGQSKATLPAVVPPTPSDTPAIEAGAVNETAIGQNDDPSSLLGTQVILECGSQVGRTKELHNEPAHSPTIAGRARVRMERELNDLRTVFEQLKSDVTNTNGRLSNLEDRQTRSDQLQVLTVEKLDQILGHLKGLGANPDSVPPTSSALVSHTSAAPVPKEEKPTIVDYNPDLYPGLKETYRRVDCAGTLSTLVNAAPIKFGQTMFPDRGKLHCHEELVHTRWFDLIQYMLTDDPKIFKCPTQDCLFRGNTIDEVREHCVTECEEQELYASLGRANEKEQEMKRIVAPSRAELESRKMEEKLQGPGLQLPQNIFEGIKKVSDTSPEEALRLASLRGIPEDQVIPHLRALAALNERARSSIDEEGIIRDPYVKLPMERISKSLLTPELNAEIDARIAEKKKKK